MIGVEHVDRAALLDRLARQHGLRVGLVLEPGAASHIAYVTRQHGRVTHLELRRQTEPVQPWRERDLELRLGVDAGELYVTLQAAVDFAIDYLAGNYGDGS